MSEFKRFLAVFISLIAIGTTLLTAGAQMLPKTMKTEGKIATSENHFSVRWMGFAPPDMSSQYPDYYVCINNLKDTTLTMNIAMQIKNQELNSYYFRITQHETPPTGWTLPTTDIDIINVDQTWTGIYSPTRTKPTSINNGKLTEQINIAVQAYYDSGYTSMYSQDNFTTTFHFINRTSPAWTQLSYDNFDDGTRQGWTSGDGGFYLSISNAYYRSFPYSATLHSQLGMDNSYIKSFNIPTSYQEAYLIFSLRSDSFQNMDFRVQYNNTVYFRPDVGPSNAIWYQFSLPLPLATTTTVYIYAIVYPGYAYLDDIYVIAR